MRVRDALKKKYRATGKILLDTELFIGSWLKTIQNLDRSEIPARSAILNSKFAQFSTFSSPPLPLLLATTISYLPCRMYPNSYFPQRPITHTSPILPSLAIDLSNRDHPNYRSPARCKRAHLFHPLFTNFQKKMQKNAKFCALLKRFLPTQTTQNHPHFPKKPPSHNRRQEPSRLEPHCSKSLIGR